jgi:hypothetical protein
MRHINAKTGVCGAGDRKGWVRDDGSEPSTNNKTDNAAQGRHFEHFCHCGKWGNFGYGVSLRNGREGNWYCFEHRPETVNKPGG